MFIKENMNPKGWKCGDCVIRACAKALNQSWDDTYNQLYEIGFKKKRMPNDDCCYCKLLESNGFEYFISISVISDGSKSIEKEIIIEFDSISLLIFNSILLLL